MRTKSLKRNRTVEESLDFLDFLDDSPDYLDSIKLFIVHFDSIPNIIRANKIDCIKATDWFDEKYKSEVKDICYDKCYSRISKKVEANDIFYFLYEDLIVNFDFRDTRILFLFRKTNLSKIEEILNTVCKFKVKKQFQKPEILLLANSRSGIETRSFEIVKPKLSIDDNYNDDFKDVHQTILKQLSQKNNKGLVLLHGKPGTGKTSYIRYLIASIKKDVIFLPPNMANAITNPDLISILIDNPNSIFVIEDAENIVVDRESDGNSSVSTLLNISDGLLSDCLNVQIICSFNTDISKIDSALMRKGRLIAKYEFKELEIEKAKHLSQKLGFKTNINKPMTLTSIYNQNEKDFKQMSQTKPIGFQSVSIDQFAEV